MDRRFPAAPPVGTLIRRTKGGPTDDWQGDTFLVKEVEEARTQDHQYMTVIRLRTGTDHFLPYIECFWEKVDE